ncbi:MAG: toll/interleukin-1 receptor domain-containing protein [Methylovirgula sp.]
MSAPVFITHSSRDYKQSRAIVDVLEKNGIPCWISERDIGAGDNYGDAIVDAIENAKAMVLVFSVNANNSDEIKKEIALASQRKLTVVPIRIEDATPSKAFRYELITRNWIDAFQDWNQAMETLTPARLRHRQRGGSPFAGACAEAQTHARHIASHDRGSGRGVAIVGGGAAYGLWPRPPSPIIIVHNDDTIHQKPAPAPQPPPASPTEPTADKTAVVVQGGGETAPAVKPAALNPAPAAKLASPSPAAKKTVVCGAHSDGSRRENRAARGQAGRTGDRARATAL